MPEPCHSNPRVEQKRAGDSFFGIRGAAFVTRWDLWPFSKGRYFYTMGFDYFVTRSRMNILPLLRGMLDLTVFTVPLLETTVSVTLELDQVTMSVEASVV